MANSDKTLKNKDQLYIYPITRERNVYDENNVNLKTKFENVVFKNDDVYVFAEEEKLKNESMINTNQFKKLTSSNVDIKEDYNFIRVTAKGTYAYADYYLDNLEVGETYTVGLDASALDLSTRPRIFIGNKTTVSDNSYRTFSLDQTSKHRISLTFEATTNILNLTLYINTTTLVENNFIEMSNITLAKGDKDIPYVGKIVRTEDVEQKFLKEEFGKQVNIININGIKAYPSGMIVTAINNHISIKGTGTISGGIEFNEIVKLKPNTQYSLKVFNQKGTIDDPLYFWDYKNAKSYGGANLNLLNSNALITTPSDISDEVRLNIYYNTSQGNIDIEFDVMLVEGNFIPPEFHNYNQKEHITNAQADFLKSEWEKSANILSTDSKTHSHNGVEFTLENNTLLMNGTAGSSGAYFNFTNYTNITSIRTGKKTYFRVFVSGESTSNQVSLNFGISGNSYYVQLSEHHGRNKYKDNLESLTGLQVYIPGGTTVTNYKMQMVISDYEIDNFYPYNGKIIHEKDIEPVLLWKNATPNASFTAQDITTLDMSKYKNIYVDWVQYANRQPERTIFPIKEFSSNMSTTISWYSRTSTDTFNRSRNIKFTTSTTVSFEDAYQGSTVKNDVMIPIAIYGSNY